MPWVGMGVAMQARRQLAVRPLGPPARVPPQAPRAAGGRWRQRRTQVAALDAAFGFDSEARAAAELRESQRLTIGLVGFGNFGQFLAAKFVRQGHHVLATSRTDYSVRAAELGVEYFNDADDFAESHPDVVVLCTSILSTETVLSHLPVQRLRRSTLFVDVLSVKQFPKRLLLSTLPDYFDILCTHPMFGPESGKHGWQGLTFMYDPVRVNPGGVREQRVANFLRCFESEGCDMVPMTCEEHDRHAASSQFITHTVGRMLGRLHLESTPVDTKGYKTLLDLVDNTANDSFELYYGLFMYNARCGVSMHTTGARMSGLK